MLSRRATLDKSEPEDQEGERLDRIVIGSWQAWAFSSSEQLNPILNGVDGVLRRLSFPI